MAKNENTVWKLKRVKLMIFFFGSSYIVSINPKQFGWNLVIKTQNTYHKASQRKGKNSIDSLMYQNRKWCEKRRRSGHGVWGIFNSLFTSKSNWNLELSLPLCCNSRKSLYVISTYVGEWPSFSTNSGVTTKNTSYSRVFISRVYKKRGYRWPIAAFLRNAAIGEVYSRTSKCL